MKFLFLMALFATTAFAQVSHPYPFPNGYPYPNNFPGRPEQFCTSKQIERTLIEVSAVCAAKNEEFAAANGASCMIKRVELNGCEAECSIGSDLYARLRMDVISRCNRGEAHLRKTFIKYY